MAQPADVPRWADARTSREADTTEPLEPRKDNGWVAAERPPAGYVNWLLSLAYRWVLYTKNLVGEAFTWTGTHSFSLLVTFSNGLIAAAGTITAGAGNIVATAGNVIAGGSVFGGSYVKTTTDPDIRHSTRTVQMSMSNFKLDPAAGAVRWFNEDFVAVGIASAAAVSWATASIPVAVGQRIRKISLTAAPVDGADSCDLWLFKIDLRKKALAPQQVLLASVSATGGRITVESAEIVEPVLAGFTYFLALQMAAGTHGGNVYGVTYSFDRVSA